jgi:hypothetical protein
MQNKKNAEIFKQHSDEKGKMKVKEFGQFAKEISGKVSSCDAIFVSYR